MGHSHCQVGPGKLAYEYPRAPPVSQKEELPVLILHESAVFLRFDSGFPQYSETGNRREGLTKPKVQRRESTDDAEILSVRRAAHGVCAKNPGGGDHLTFIEETE